MREVDETELWSELHAVWWRKPRNPRVVVSGNFATPWSTMAVVDSALPDYRLWAANYQKGPVGIRDGVTPETVFIGPGMRGLPNLDYYPMRLALAPRLFETELPPDIVVINTTLPDTGWVSLGIECNILPAAIRACRENGGIVVAQFNDQMPYTFGDAEIGIEEIDFGYVASEPLSSPVPVEPTEVQRQIAENVAALIPDGATLQAGIGAVPDTVLAILAEKGRGTYQIWTEMFSDGVMALEEAGMIDPYIVGSFAFGSQEFYRWLDRNPDVWMYDTQLVNDPAEIAEIDQFVSINSALEVDLWGQCNGGFVKGQFHSGFGGATDFTQGASHSRGGLAIVALPAMHPKAGVSTIVPTLHGPATSVQPSYVVTEYGAAKIQGVTASEQAENLAAISHPLARDVLRAAYFIY